MNVAKTCSADEVKVKLCFFVKVRNAKGRRVAGGSITGRILALAAGGPTLNGLMGCAGVPNAGEDDGIGFEGVGVAGCRKIGAAFKLFGRDIAIV